MIRKTNFIGSVFALDLANTTIGKDQQAVEYRFGPGQPGTYDQLELFFILGKAGYSAGDNGIIDITVTNGNAACRERLIPQAADSDADKLRTWTPMELAWPLDASKPWTVRMANAHQDPMNNYCSIDSLGNGDPCPVYNPQVALAPADASVWMLQGSQWIERVGYLPIVGLRNSKTGASTGIGYMERETLQQRGRQKFVLDRAGTLGNVWIRGATPLASGASLMVALNGQSVAGWSDAHLDAWGVLRWQPILRNDFKAGDALVLDFTGGAYALRKGIQEGFGPGSCFEGGSAECSGDGGKTWTPWVMQTGAMISGLCDLQFAVEVL